MLFITYDREKDAFFDGDGKRVVPLVGMRANHAGGIDDALAGFGLKMLPSGSLVYRFREFADVNGAMMSGRELVWQADTGRLAYDKERQAFLLGESVIQFQNDEGLTIAPRFAKWAVVDGVKIPVHFPRTVRLDGVIYSGVQVRNMLDPVGSVQRLGGRQIVCRKMAGAYVHPPEAEYLEIDFGSRVVRVSLF